MQHVNMSEHFAYSETPFPAFRVEATFGRNKRDRAFLPTKIAPVITHRTVTTGGKRLYSGADAAAAEDARKIFDATESARGLICPDRAYVEHDPAVLPAGQFRVIKTRDKGTILVVPGEDTSRRCLLFASCKGGFRGAVSISTPDTAGQVIMECSAGNACDSRCDVAVILDVGQSLVFRRTGRSCHEYVRYAWDGTRIDRTVIPAAEWQARGEVAEGDVL